MLRRGGQSSVAEFVGLAAMRKRRAQRGVVRAAAHVGSDSVITVESTSCVTGSVAPWRTSLAARCRKNLARRHAQAARLA